eukprot:7377888-Prymnesium_polylepis.1
MVMPSWRPPRRGRPTARGWQSRGAARSCGAGRRRRAPRSPWAGRGSSAWSCAGRRTGTPRSGRRQQTRIGCGCTQWPGTLMSGYHPARITRLRR